MKKLGFGCMRLPLREPGVQTSIDLDTVSALFDSFLKNGFTYFDTAYFYHENTSERAVKTCLVDRYPRESFILADKLPIGIIESADGMEPIFRGQLEHCGVDYFDYYLLHDLQEETWKKVRDFDAYAFGRRMKDEGHIKKLGFSFHGTPEMLEEILTLHPETEFVQLQLNYLDWEDPDIQSRRCYEIARAHGKEIIVMEPCKGGELSSVPEKAEALMREVRPDDTPSAWAFRYVAGLEGVVMVLSGMNTMQQLEDNMHTFADPAPLTDGEMDILRRTVEEIKSVATIKCTACRYCESHCPMKIQIPDCFAFYNRYMRTKLPGTISSYGFNIGSGGRGKPSECVGCRACTVHCPQHLDIPELLKDVVKVLEGN